MLKISVAGLAASLVSLAVIAGLGTGSFAWGIGSVVAGATVVAVMTLAGRHNPTSCPRCATLMPALRWPASVRQALWGGWTCPSCGCEMDRSGHEMSRESPTRV